MTAQQIETILTNANVANAQQVSQQIADAANQQQIENILQQAGGANNPQQLARQIWSQMQQTRRRTQQRPGISKGLVATMIVLALLVAAIGWIAISANGKSSDAKTDAATAKTDAATAKTDAATAKTDAATAKTDAATAKTDAATAKTDAATANSRVDAVVKNHNELVEVVNGHSDQFEAVDGRLTKIEGRVDKLEKGQKREKRRVAKFDDRLKALEAEHAPGPPAPAGGTSGDPSAAEVKSQGGTVKVTVTRPRR